MITNLSEKLYWNHQHCLYLLFDDSIGAGTMNPNGSRMTKTFKGTLLSITRIWGD
jgi:glycyl-tRNA synthetase alpha subunit